MVTDTGPGCSQETWALKKPDRGGCEIFKNDRAANQCDYSLTISNFGKKRFTNIVLDCGSKLPIVWNRIKYTPGARNTFY